MATPLPVTVSAAVTPKPAPQPKPRVVSITKRFSAGHLVVVVHVRRGTSGLAGVRLRIHVRRGSSTVATVTRVTRTGGVATWRSAKRLHPGRYVATANLR